MGFEAFRVELRGGKAQFPEVDEAVRKLPHIKPDQDSVPTKGSTFYVMDDGRHTIEIEVIDSPVRLSCRFTLCHPPSIDSVFLDFVHDLMLRLGMAAKVCDDVLAAHSGSFSFTEFHDFTAVAKHYIASRRAEWLAAFGDQPLSAGTNEVYQRIILPRCQPGIGQLV